MKKPPSRLNMAVKGILTALAMLLILEGAARVAKTFRDDLRPAADRWYDYSSELGWQRRPDFKGEIDGQPVAFDGQGYLDVDSRQAADAATTPCVLTLGDSVTFGYGVPSRQTFSEQLDARLPQASVINLGVNGYSAFQSECAMENFGHRLKPALIILSGQYNDRRYVLDASQVDSAKHFRQLARDHRLRQWTRHVYLVRGLALLMRKAGLVKATEDPDRPNAGLETIDHPINLMDVPTRDEPERYREQLTRAARWCREQGIPLVFMTLADNPVMTRPIEEAVRAETAGDDTAAIDLLKSLLEPEGVYTALARRMLADLYHAQGHDAETTAVASVARPLFTLHGGFAIYRDEIYNRVMREVAAKEEVPLAEAAPWLAAHGSLFLDQCHFNPGGHAGIAALLAARIAALNLDELGPVDTRPVPETAP